MARTIRCCVVAPTYNNDGTLLGVIRDVEAMGLKLIVVNDGATDGTACCLSRWGGTVLTHAGNRGKGAAIRTGFKHASRLGFTHAVTIDTDGQLDAAEIPGLVAAAGREPEALVVGMRNDRAADYPALSRLGRRVSNLLIRLESGAPVGDSQCGFRVYPLAMMAELRCTCTRFDFETEVIVRAARAGYRIRNVPITCRYFPGDQRVTHYRKVVDTLRCARLHMTLAVPRRATRLGAAASRRGVMCGYPSGTAPRQ